MEVPATEAPAAEAPATEVSAAEVSATEVSAAEVPAPPSCHPLQFKESRSEESPPALATDAALLRGCQAIAARSRKRLGRQLEVVPEEDGKAQIEPLLRCLDSGKGAWTFEITSASSRVIADGVTSSGKPEIGITMLVRPVFLDENGTHTVGPTVTLRAGNGSFAHLTFLTDILTFDWDSDGRKELAFSKTNSQEENNDHVAQADRYWVVTMRRGAVLDYVKNAEQISAIHDVDGDRRPDLLMKSPWVVDGPCGIAGVHVPGPRFMLHALPDGTFSDRDDIAQGFVVNRCPQPPDDLLEESDDEHPSKLIGCALWWGRQPGAIVRMIQDKRPADEAPLSSCFPRRELLRIARVPPPAPFRLSCAPKTP